MFVKKTEAARVKAGQEPLRDQLTDFSVEKAEVRNNGLHCLQQCRCCTDIINSILVFLLLILLLLLLSCAVADDDMDAGNDPGG